MLTWCKDASVVGQVHLWNTHYHKTTCFGDYLDLAACGLVWKTFCAFCSKSWDLSELFLRIFLDYFKLKFDSSRRWGMICLSSASFTKMSQLPLVHLVKICFCDTLHNEARMWKIFLIDEPDPQRISWLAFFFQQDVCWVYLKWAWHLLLSQEGLKCQLTCDSEDSTSVRESATIFRKNTFWAGLMHLELRRIVQYGLKKNQTSHGRYSPAEFWDC